jgi:hypothetical protein
MMLLCILAAAVLLGQAWRFASRNLEGLLEGIGPLQVFGLLLAALYITITVHEIGHLALGTLCGFRFLVVTLGPVTVVRGEQGLTVRIQIRQLFAGRTSMVPRRDEQITRRLALLIAGGPTASMATVLVCALLLTTLPPGAARTLAWFTSVLSAITLIGSLNPGKSRGLASDGRLLRLLLQGGAERERFTNINLTLAAQHRGVRPAAWDGARVNQAASVQDGSNHELAAAGLAYYHALDRGNVAAADGYLHRMLEMHSAGDADFKSALFSEAAYFTALHIGDAAQAREWLERVAAPYRARLSRTWVRAEAAVLLAEGHAAEAYAAASKGLGERLPRHPLGTTLAELAWLQALLRSCRAQA